MGKKNYNLRKAVVNDSVRLQIQSQDNASSRDIIDDSDPISDANTGLTQKFQDLSVKEQFHTTTGTILFIPETVNKLYKVQVLENSGHETKLDKMIGAQSTTRGLMQNQFWPIRSTNIT